MVQQTIFITGAAGYVGEMLCEQYALRDDVQTIIALDRVPQTAVLANISKLTYIEHNLADDGWQEQVLKFTPSIVIHCAWQIRELYGKTGRAQQWRWNIDGSDNLFDFALSAAGVQRLIYFSTAAGYAARVANTFEHEFTEEEGFRPDAYSYAKEKTVSEEHLRLKWEAAKAAGRSTPQISIVRPAAITGPRGRYQRVRFGLQSALQGNLSGGILNRLITALTAVMPASSGWLRQFVHEDDITDMVAHFAFEEIDWEYEAFNATSLSEPVYAKEMAQAMGKRVLPITPGMARLAFFAFWHGTRGRVPTAAHVWRFYCYPIRMSGDKLARVYSCRYSSRDAIFYTDGRYSDRVPPAKQRIKPQSLPSV